VQVVSEAKTDPHQLSLAVEVTAGEPARFLISHHVSLNDDDGSAPGPAQWKLDGQAIVVSPAPATDLGRRFPQGYFRIAPDSATQFERVSGDELLFLDGRSRNSHFSASSPPFQEGRIELQRPPGGETPAGAFAGRADRKHPSNQERMARVPGTERRATLLLPQALRIREPVAVVSRGRPAARSAASRTGQDSPELQAAIDRKPSSPLRRPFPIRVSDAHVLAERRRGTSYNVIGMVEGSDPRTQERNCCRQRALTDHDGAWDATLRPGADDNCFGHGWCSRAGARLRRQRRKAKRSLLVRDFRREERGCSLALLRRASAAPARNTRAVITSTYWPHETPSRQTDGLMDIAPDTSNELNLIGTINSPTTAPRPSAQRVRGAAAQRQRGSGAALTFSSGADQFPFACTIPGDLGFTGLSSRLSQSTDSSRRSIRENGENSAPGLSRRLGLRERRDGRPVCGAAGDGRLAMTNLGRCRAWRLAWQKPRSGPCLRGCFLTSTL